MKTNLIYSISGLVTFLCCIFFAPCVKGQIENQIIAPGHSSKYGTMFSKAKNLPVYKLPNIDVIKLLKEDSLERLQGKPFRFGKSVDVNIDLIANSSKSIHSDTTLYFYQIESKNAYSLNLIFDRFVLSDNARLFIYNTDKTMVYGPVTNKDNPPNGVFWTDLIRGESIIIQVIIVGGDTEETKMHVSKVIHGYQNTFAGYGQSASCNRNLACLPQAFFWQNDGNSVAMVLLADGTRFCSGSLLNNACQDFTPNFLTAFHCLDANRNGALSGTEQTAVNNWVFRFLYQSPSCAGGDGTTYQLINGSTLRSASQASDFALLLLNARPTGNVHYAGWSRTNVAATSAAAIHHPNGDVKKISIDDNPLTNVAVATLWDGLTCPPNTHWQSIFEIGTVQPGSSGSPIFDQNNRVVGQLHGDYLNTNNDYCGNHRGHYGRFDVSWIGGGTAATRLSTWLTNDPNVMNVNRLAIPSIVPASGSGYPVVCSTSSGFNLVNAPTTHNVIWTTTPNLTIISQGSSSVLVRYSGVQNGTGTITANLSNSNTAFCSVSTPFSINVQAGPVNTGQIFVSGQAGVCPGYSYTYTATVPGGHKSGYTYSWTYPSGWSVNSQYQNTITLYVPQYSPQYGPVQASVNNGCGVSGYSGITAYPGFSCGGYSYSYFPNPVEDELTVEVVNASDGSLLRNGAKVQFETSVYDGQQNVLRHVISTENRVILNLNDLKKGIYFLQIVDDHQSIRERLIIN